MVVVETTVVVVVGGREVVVTATVVVVAIEAAVVEGEVVVVVGAKVVEVRVVEAAVPPELQAATKNATVRRPHENLKVLSRMWAVLHRGAVAFLVFLATSTGTRIVTADLVGRHGCPGTCASSGSRLDPPRLAFWLSQLDVIEILD